MKLVVQVADGFIYELKQVQKDVFDRFQPGLVGIPVYFQYWEGAPPIVYLKPSKECKVYKLVEQDVQ